MRELRLRLALFLLRKEVQDMAVVYATLIIKGRSFSFNAFATKTAVVLASRKI